MMNKRTFKAVYSVWRETKSRLVKESTMATYVANAEKHILPVFGDCTKIVESEVQSFALGKFDEGLSVRTVKDILLVLKMVAAFGSRKEWFDYHGWKISMPKNDGRQRLDVFSLADQKAIMVYLRRHLSLRNLGLYICLCTGMRIGEICALKWGDVCLRMKTIKVERTIERVYCIEGRRRYTKILIGTPKTTSSCREIPICRDLMRMLRPFADTGCADFFVLSNSDKPVEPRIYRHYYRRLMTHLGMPDLKFHGLRHTFATRCIESKCDYKTVSAILGHSSISTTLNLYVHPDIGQKRKCIDKMLKAVVD